MESLFRSLDPEQKRWAIAII